MSSHKHSIAIIGAGKVGTAVGYLLAQRGHRITSAVATGKVSLERAASFLPEANLLQDSSKATANADIILITTKDGQIKTVCNELANKGAILPAHTVIHMSGAGSLELLSSAGSAGARVASLHPIQSFASVELAIEKLPGSYFGLTAGDEAARDIATQIAHDLGGKVIEVADKDKSLYHAAACITSNFLVTLLHTAKEVYKESGLDESIVLEAMMPLIKGTISNIENVGTVAALTGPIARGDVKIIKQHLESLAKLGSDIVNTYKALGLQTVEVAIKSGALNRQDADKIIEMLE